MQFATAAYQERLDNDRSTPCAVHFGLKQTDLARLPESWAYAIDGDGWVVWGEAVGLNGNDGETYHVVALTHVPYDFVPALVGLFGDRLVTMKSTGQVPTQVVITNPFDWSSQVATYDTDGVLHGAIQSMKNREQINA